MEHWDLPFASCAMDRIAVQESKLGFTLPIALREWYALFGGITDYETDSLFYLPHWGYLRLIEDVELLPRFCNGVLYFADHFQFEPFYGLMLWTDADDPSVVDNRVGPNNEFPVPLCRDFSTWISHAVLFSLTRGISKASTGVQGRVKIPDSVTGTEFSELLAESLAPVDIPEIDGTRFFEGNGIILRITKNDDRPDVYLIADNESCFQIFDKTVQGYIRCMSPELLRSLRTKEQ